MEQNKKPLDQAEVAGAPIEREVSMPESGKGPRPTSDVGIIAALGVSETYIINKELPPSLPLAMLAAAASEAVEKARNAVCSKVARASKLTGHRYSTEGSVTMINKRVFSVVLVTRVE